MQKRTKIVATIGPASGSPDMLRSLVEAGLNVCRLNFSHGTHEQHAEYIAVIRALAAERGEPLTVLQDLQGPKIRVQNVAPEGVVLVDGKEVVFTTDPKSSSVLVDYVDLHLCVQPGGRILMDDGLLEVEVVSVQGREITCRVIHGGTLLPHKGVNLPGTKLNISSLTDKDRQDLKFGVAQNVDWVAISFVRSAQDIRELKQLIRVYEEELGLPHEPAIRVMAKIEKAEAIQQLDEIIAEVDGIMVARGDLGVETAFEKVPVLQKQIVSACLRAAKPVVVATQMLDSMIRNPRPTRAEISDIANAVIDHADATMLSGETTTGKYPLEAVQAMAGAISATEESVYDDVSISVQAADTQEVAMTNVASALAMATGAKAVLVASLSGQAARFVSRERPALPIFVPTTSERVACQLMLSWAVVPFVVPACETVSEFIDLALTELVKQQKLQKGDEVVVVAGEPLSESGMMNLVEIRKV